MFRTDRPLDNPINWSFKAGQLFGIRIRVHVTLVLCAFVLLALELPKDRAGLSEPFWQLVLHTLGTYGLLFLIVLLHELGHCAGARYVGGEADEVLLWPLGGLAYVNPPNHPAAHLITTVAGPTVNVVLCMICTAALVGWTGSLGAVPWNPLHPMLPVDRGLHVTAGQVWLMRLFGLSYVVLLVNLLPIYPFDGGRIVQALLWPRKGYRASMEIATSTGMMGAIAVGVFGLFAQESWLLLMIAVFGYLTCFQMRLGLQDREPYEPSDFGQNPADEFESTSHKPQAHRSSASLLERRRVRKQEKTAELERQRREAHEKAVEAVLRKISGAGLASLTPGERRILEEETNRKRGKPGDTAAD